MGFISEFLGGILGYIMWAIYAVVKNYGIAIALFTLIIRLIMFPMSVKQQKSQASIAAIQPKLDSLKKKYANNPTKMQEEQMKLYEEENINPMASCGPMIFQLIFLYGVFDVVYRPLTHILRISEDTLSLLKDAVMPLYEGTKLESNFSQRPELYILRAIKDNPGNYADSGVSADILQKIMDFDNKLFGIIDLGSIPSSVFEEGTVWNAGTIGLLLIPILSGAIQLATTIYNNFKQKKLNPESAAQMSSMNIMFYLFPIMSVWIAFSFPAGIGYYWICSSVVGIIQMVVLNKIYTPEYVAKLVEKDKVKRKNKKRSAFMEKYKQMVNEQLNQQNSDNNKNKRISASGVVDEETDDDIRMSKAQMKEYERKIIAQARRRQAEKYGDVYSEDDD